MNKLPEWNELTGLQRQSTKALWGILCDAINKDTSQKSDVSYNVKVNIKNETDEPISNAEVTITGNGENYTSVTGSAGGCTIKNIKQGDYICIVTASDYIVFEEKLAILQDKTLNITLKK